MRITNAELEGSGVVGINTVLRTREPYVAQWKYYFVKVLNLFSFTFFVARSFFIIFAAEYTV
jgi:hypothetical protein